MTPQIRPAGLALQDVDVVVGGRKLIEGLNLSLSRGTITAILGVSGSGKTTLLNAIAGLIPLASGCIRPLYNADGAGRLAYVFQRDALFPWMTLGKNIAQGQGVRFAPKHEHQTRMLSLAAQLGLADALDKYPAQLSGGMAQRGQIGRALASDPELLLLDEALSKLDLQTKHEIEILLQNVIAARPELTTLMVTHDVDEALALGDRVLVLTGSPASISADLPIARARPRGIDWRSDPRYLEMRKMISIALQIDFQRRQSESRVEHR